MTTNGSMSGQKRTFSNRSPQKSESPGGACVRSDGPVNSWSPGNPLERPVTEAVDFAVHSAKLLLGWLPGQHAFLASKTFLEVGPGQDIGFPLILMGFGAKVILVDRYLCQWDESLHPAYYRALRKTVTETFPGIDTGSFHRWSGQTWGARRQGDADHTARAGERQ